MNRYDDEHFKRWPFPVSDDEIRTDGYLKSLTPAEELALFLSLRGHCLKEAGRTAEAIAAYSEAVRFAPESRPYRLLLADAQNPAPVRAQRRTAAVCEPAALGFPTTPLNAGSQPGLVPDPNPRLTMPQH
jgi:tetratricopeptide (TPR) repeat protein